MTDRPIIFSAPMVRALLDGTKTQTRRVLKVQPPKNEDFPGSYFGLGRKVADGVKWHSLNQYPNLHKHPTKWDLDGSVGVARCAGFPMEYDARFAIGDRLWVRENFQLLSFGDYVPTKARPADVRFAATDRCADLPSDVRGYPWRPSIHMPRWASRLTLIVTDVRVQRLQDISDNDALAEGVNRTNTSIYGYATKRFERLWNSINGPDAWEANPWVVAVSFEVHQSNIDQLELAQEAA